MYSILTGTILVSILHALIPSHWLPLLAISKQYQWSKQQTLLATLYMGLAHVLSTIVLGVLLSAVSNTLYSNYQHYFDIITPLLLVALGIFFIYRHYTHHHFHLHKTNNNQQKTTTQIVLTLVGIMFLSPCLEVEGYFVLAGKFGWQQVLLVAIIYLVVSITGMLLWVWLALKGIKKMDWHKIEHNAGLITGLVLILTGILTYIIH